MNLWTVAAYVGGYFAGRLADSLLGLEELADRVASHVHELLTAPPWLAGGAP
jgi:hypothetical protein